MLVTYTILVKKGKHQNCIYAISDWKVKLIIPNYREMKIRFFNRQEPKTKTL